MDSIFDSFLGLLLGGIATYWVYSFFRKRRGKEVTKHQSVVLLEKIKSVCKLVSVEGDFAEIYTYENTKDRFLSMISSKKKALIVVKAKAHIGYDLKKIQIKSDVDIKKVTLTSFPQPEILSVEPDLEFYDIKNGMFNAFTPDDLTLLNKEVKEHIRAKVVESGLMVTARKEALDTILLVESLAETIGWKLDYSALQLNTADKALLEENKSEI
ncbi:DUF4230 domain-containing protein [Aggregatimonas sangjinii]|uniref:DUF4230 domain-containing protein n=1 Tax=Aggregatimonas sangjinii TaxID=2583587 RepID=A0A5B7SWJ1_9FLAO|nr:DUF4230 domain-containing protein [Aggregatimonas sangjinii]QCX01301.1 DUF4230 domain-containing protein [Aggregatimonas sangjinii]